MSQKKANKNKVGENKKRGRPTVFNDIIQEKILSLVQQGATEFEIAERIGVTERTINYWKRKHDDFFHALKGSRDLADQMVEASLFQRACGYSHPAEKHFLNKVKNDEGEWVTEVITHHYQEHYPPSELAAIFWLKNRQPDRWKDKPLESDTENNGNEPDEIVIEFQDETPIKDAE